MYRLILLAAVIVVVHCSWYGDFDHGFDHGFGPGHDHGFGPGHDHGFGPGSGSDSGPDSGHGSCRFRDHGPHHHPGHGWGPHGHAKYKSHNRFFEKLASTVIETDQYSQTSCKNYTNSNVQVLDGNTSYQLIYTLPDAKSDNIEVKIKHRVIYMNASKTSGGDSDYYDVRVLPQRLDTARAGWVYDNNQLTVVIPYNRTLQSDPTSNTPCADINRNVTTVPKEPSLMFKFGEDETTETPSN